jgi:BirA family biotin operon repressor/biotin-[acetyl-CoA-carboxylase] ligase
MAFHRALHHFFESVDSTNDEAARWLKTGKIPEGSCIVAEFQTKGKGQRNNTWVSANGQNLMCSFILYPSMHDDSSIFYFSKAMACAVRDTIADSGCTDVTIKWPNDILIDRKKVAGILIENQWGALGWSSAIVGIGINVNQTAFEGISATSMVERIGQSIQIAALLSTLENHIHHYYQIHQSEKFDEINRNYHQHLFGLNTSEMFEAADVVFTAKIKRVNTNGMLELEQECGTTRGFGLKEVKLLL